MTLRRTTILHSLSYIQFQGISCHWVICIWVFSSRFNKLLQNVLQTDSSGAVRPSVCVNSNREKKMRNTFGVDAGWDWALVPPYWHVLTELTVSLHWNLVFNSVDVKDKRYARPNCWNLKSSNWSFTSKISSTYYTLNDTTDPFPCMSRPESVQLSQQQFLIRCDIDILIHDFVTESFLSVLDATTQQRRSDEKRTHLTWSTWRIFSIVNESGRIQTAHHVSSCRN